MNFFKKLFGSNSKDDSNKEPNKKQPTTTENKQQINKESVAKEPKENLTENPTQQIPIDQVPIEQLPWMTDTRLESMRICKAAGFKAAKSLPTDWERTLRPASEIAGRLHAIKALVLWLMVPEASLQTERILNFVSNNQLKDFMTKDELVILDSPRDDEALRNSIGWKFENAWPLAWYFGYSEPEITGEMMSGDQMQEILTQYTSPIDEKVDDWVSKQQLLNEDQLSKKEDLFYCLHNAVRSAQMGGNTVPEGFHPVGNGGVIHERRHSLTWMLSDGKKWEETDLST